MTNRDKERGRAMDDDETQSIHRRFDALWRCLDELGKQVERVERRLGRSTIVYRREDDPANAGWPLPPFGVPSKAEEEEARNEQLAALYRRTKARMEGRKEERLRKAREQADLRLVLTGIAEGFAQEIRRSFLDVCEEVGLLERKRKEEEEGEEEGAGEGEGG